MNRLHHLAAAFLAVLTYGVASTDAEAAPLRARHVEVGGSHACAILRDRRLKCWGHNQYGQLGLGDRNDRGDATREMGDALPFVDLGEFEVAAIALGASHTCALSMVGQVKCWGKNTYGQLGYGDNANRGDGGFPMGTTLPALSLSNSPQVIAVSITAGAQHTCVILSDGTTRCWGRNNQGQLGLGNTDDYADESDERLTSIALDLGTGRTATQIVAGSYHTCALLDDRTVKCWGDNTWGQLGLGDQVRRGDDRYEMGDYLPAIDFGPYGAPPLRIDAGHMHTCARMDDGELDCWGENSIGSLGVGHEYDVGDGPWDMGYFLQPVELPASMPYSTSVAAGGQFTCATGGWQVTCWGVATNGQTGHGSQNVVGNEPDEMGGALPLIDLGIQTVVQISAGTATACARSSHERVKCWGANSTGQLGQGDTLDRGNLPDQMGAALRYIDLGTESR